MRYENYKKFDAEIRHFNLSQMSSYHGHNFLSDLSDAERKERLGLSGTASNVENPVFAAQGNATIPSSVDWRSVSPAVVNAVKDQGQCGSCWSFASTAVMESAHAIFAADHTLYSLSEQNLVSCSFLQGNLGCNGGWYYYAWKYTLTHPLEKESDYPYVSGTTTKSGSCTYDKTKGVVLTTGQTSVSTDTTSIMTAIAQQPNAVAIQADTSYFQSYKSGVLTDAAACGSTIDHAVTAVGYG